MTTTTATTEPAPDYITELAHGLLRLVGDYPGELGRLRAARIAGGRTFPAADEVEAARLARYAVESAPLTIAQIVELVDALIAGGLIHHTSRPTRPTLALTRAGHRGLDALETRPT
jgi:hypothetical protein